METRNLANSQWRLVVYLLFTGFFYIPGGCLGFQPPTSPVHLTGFPSKILSFFVATSLYSIRWKAGNSWPCKFFLNISTPPPNKKKRVCQNLKVVILKENSHQDLKKTDHHFVGPSKNGRLDVFWAFFNGSKNWFLHPLKGSQPQRPQLDEFNQPVNHQVSQRQVRHGFFNDEVAEMIRKLNEKTR